ncbi:hypothetical protein KYB31_15740 [Clostridium felsineum]|uniref:hypothetical protein n=1 Tax=Clostridium felsineum TaxID=36839 RepID=UPI00214D5A96|nr:hypothetical protein [Clostridium felsineum]MCR3760430.1 hypothetical protein [Clostridium felsineum]
MEYTNIQNSTKDGLSEVLKIPVRAYDLNGNHTDLGVLYSEIAVVEPDLAHKYPGLEDYMPNESALFSYFIDSIQRLNAKIVNLESEISELKASK